MRSFSNLWFWIALAVVWSTTSHWVLGVPYDMITRARRQQGQAVADLEDIARVNVNRLRYIARVSGLWLLGFPMSVVGLLSLSTARLIEVEQSTGELLCKRLTRHRIYTQIIGTLSIFVTALWGMYKNISIGVL